MVADNSEKSAKSVANGSLISTVSSKEDLPNAIIVTQVPEFVSAKIRGIWLGKVGLYSKK